MKEICDHCKMGELQYVEEDPPWHTEHFICPVCDSTYNVEIDIVFEADFEIFDSRFKGCDLEADYSIFKEGKPHHMDIEVDDLTIPVGDELDFKINGELLAKVKVARDREAEFDHWSDEDVDFPEIKSGDELTIWYEGVMVIKGVFR